MKNSPSSSPIWSLAAACALALTLAACGGGGSESPLAKVNGMPGTQSKPQTQTSQAAPHRCAHPRSGIAPDGKPWPDTQGTLADEKAWVGAFMKANYLWYKELPALDANRYASPKAYFEKLISPTKLPSGVLRDRWHYAVPSSWFEQSMQGVDVGYGVQWAVFAAANSIKQVFVQTSEQVALGKGIHRGMELRAIDGKAVSSYTREQIGPLLYPSQAGVQHSFSFFDHTTSQDFGPATLQSQPVTSDPVPLVISALQDEPNIAYVLFHAHNAAAEQKLITAITQLKQSGVKDLIVDMRYNGGGYVALAAELGYMLAGSSKTQGKTFERIVFNDKRTHENDVYPFYAQAVGYSAPKGSNLPSLGLSSVTIITSRDTASASESVINGLRGIGVRVNLIGSATTGKPYGFLPQDNCGMTYMAVEFKGVNALGQADYDEGFTPTCAAADDLHHKLGSPQELSLAQAIHYIKTGSCNAAYERSGAASAAALSSTQGHAVHAPSVQRLPPVRDFFNSNRILGTP